jgi:hypothetical protein
VHDENRIEHLLLFICAEAATLRAELAAIADDLRAEELNRFEGTLSDIQEQSAALLMALPAATVN